MEWTKLLTEVPACCFTCVCVCCLQGYNEFSLLSLSCSDYLSLPSVGIQIKNRLKDENVALSLPSQVGVLVEGGGQP